jgi:hypothetical protein
METIGRLVPGSREVSGRNDRASGHTSSKLFYCINAVQHAIKVGPKLGNFFVVLLLRPKQLVKFFLQFRVFVQVDNLVARRAFFVFACIGSVLIVPFSSVHDGKMVKPVTVDFFEDAFRIFFQPLVDGGYVSFYLLFQFWPADADYSAFIDKDFVFFVKFFFPFTEIRL